MIEFQLAQLVVSEVSEQQVIVLKEIDGERTFQIVIGPYEIMAIERHVKGWKPERPLTHDLIENVIQGMGGTLEKLVVCDLRDNTFFGELYIKTKDDVHRIDCRPSDGIALAVRANAKIFVEDHVVNEASQ